MMDRLDFLKYAGWAAMGAVLLPRIQGCATSPTSAGVDVTYNVGDFPALATVGNAALDASHSVILQRVSTTQFHAYSAVCPHQGCTVDQIDNSRHRYTCPCHDSVFANDGSVIQGPANSGLTALTATYDSAAGTVHVVG